MLLGGIEAGGTKMVCAVSTEEGRLLERVVIPTKTPETTIPPMIDFFKQWQPAALGIGSFGPVNLNKASAAYGHIMKTPKKEWAHYDLLGAFRDGLKIPAEIDTDVNAAALAEVTWGAAKGCNTAIYITVGTGVGVGVYCNGGLLHGLVHPEAGHILISRRRDDPFAGCCPFHDNCLEGLASGPAIEQRWGRPGGELADRDEVWELEADYIGQAVTNYILTYSPQRVILWGGVMHQQRLFPMVRARVREMLGGYVQHELTGEQIDAYIAPPGLGEDPGILGAVLLGKQALSKEEGCDADCSSR